MAGERIAGTLVAAVLESAGYRYQQEILDVLGDPLQNQIGGLVYLFAIIVAVASVAKQGSYKLGAWLLIGPPLFFSVLIPRENVPLAKWQFGAVERNSEAVREEAKTIGAIDQASVSKLFEKYTRMMSTIVNKMVETINGERLNTDLWFIVKAELYASLYTPSPKNIGLIRLINQSMMIDCHDAVEYAKQAVNPVRKVGAEVFLAEGESAEDDRKKYLMNRATDARRRFESEEIYFKKFALHHDALEYVKTILPANHPDRAGLDSNAFNCEQIWRFTSLGLLKEAERFLAENQRIAQKNGINPAELENLYRRAHGQEGKPIGLTQPSPNGDPLGYNPADVNLLVNIIAKYMLRNQINASDTSPGDFIASMAGRDGFAELRTTPSSDVSLVEKSRLGAREWSERTRLVSAASSLPYYQGLILFMLGTTFPFFALLLLIPGRHGGFLTWFAMWMWAKSWDIGFAIMMLLDDILFGMLANNIRPKDPSLIMLNQEMDLTLASLQELDPSFQLATYYTIIAVSVLGVPATMAMLLLSSLKGGADLIKDAAGKYAGHFAESQMAEVEGEAQDVVGYRFQKGKRELANAMYAAAIDRDESPYDENPGGPNPGAGSPALAGSGVGVNGPGSNPMLGGSSTGPIANGRGQAADRQVVQNLRPQFTGSFSGLEERLYNRATQVGWFGGLSGTDAALGGLAGGKAESVLGSDYLGKALKLYAGPQSAWYKNSLDQQKKVMDRYLSYIPKHAAMDFDTSANGRALRALAGVYTTINTPTSDKYHEFANEDYQSEIFALQTKINEKRALIATATSINDGFWKVIDPLKKGVRGGLTLDQQAKMDALLKGITTKAIPLGQLTATTGLITESWLTDMTPEGIKQAYEEVIDAASSSLGIAPEIMDPIKDPNIGPMTTRQNMPEKPKE